MAATPSTMIPLGTTAPAFELADPSGVVHSFASVRGERGTLVMFVCNHCPFVIHVAEQLSMLGRDLATRGIGVVAINANDVATHPDDAPPKMAEAARAWNWAFPYVFDESQAIARAYDAACTPDFFLFDGDGALVYRGQLDGSRPNNETPVTGADLRGAVEALLDGTGPLAEQRPSLGCNIKWKPGNAPA